MSTPSKDKEIPLGLNSSIKRVQKCPKRDIKKNHACPLCGSIVKKGTKPPKMTRVQRDIFRNLILALTLEIGGDGDGGDCSNIDGDILNLGCKDCIDKFNMMESLQRQISQLKDQVEDILGQLRKTIWSRRKIIVGPLGFGVSSTETVVCLTGQGHHPTFGDVDDTDDDYDEFEGEDDDVIPVMMDFLDEHEVKFEPDQLPDDDDDGGGGLMDPLGGVGVDSREDFANNPDQGEPDAKKSRKCKVRAAATHRIPATMYSNNDVQNSSRSACTLMDSISSTVSSMQIIQSQPTTTTSSNQTQYYKATCFFCESRPTFSSRKDYNDHKRMHQEKVNCPRCHTEFSTEENLERHKKKCLLGSRLTLT